MSYFPVRDDNWIPPAEEEAILGFKVQDEPKSPPQTKLPDPRRNKLVTSASERFANLATSFFMYSILGLAALLVIGIAVRMVKWVVGI